ncbi:Uncharacterised protein [Vibrio cholerae]|nr:Uncharacterised protein [Vibrio cholerae]
MPNGVAWQTKLRLHGRCQLLPVLPQNSPQRLQPVCAVALVAALLCLAQLKILLPCDVFPLLLF